jgi:hypothetical protein
MLGLMVLAQVTALTHLDRGQRGLRSHHVGAEHWVRQLELPERCAGRRRVRWVERHKHVGRAGRQVLQQVEPVADAHRGLLAAAGGAANQAAGPFGTQGNESSWRLSCTTLELCAFTTALAWVQQSLQTLHLPRKFQDAHAVRLRGMSLASVCSHTSFSL